MDFLRMEGERLIADLRLYLTNYYDMGTKVVPKDEVIRMRLRRYAAWKVEPGFSIVKVNCHSCGGSLMLQNGAPVPTAVRIITPSGTTGWSPLWQNRLC